MYNERDEIIFNMVHDLCKISPHLKTLREHAKLLSKLNPIHKSLDYIEYTLNNVIEDGCKSIKEAHDE